MPQRLTVNLVVNGETFEREVEPRILLSDFLRHELGLTGTHVGCEHGVCGACTVLVEGEAVRACLMFAVQVDGREVTTVEGLAPNAEELHPLQEAFWESHGLQCGFCTPGILLSMVPFLESNSDPTEAEIREALSGNLCRCTGYQNIVEAVRRAAAGQAVGGAAPAAIDAVTPEAAATPAAAGVADEPSRRGGGDEATAGEEPA